MTYAKEVTYFQCPGCNKVWPKAEDAIKCCAQRYCEDCGVAVKNYRICCEPCGQKRQFDKAEKLQPEQWDGWVCWDGIGYNEGYFSSIGALIEHCDDEGIKVPEWVFCCTATQHKLDIDLAIESMLEEAYEDAYHDLVDVGELQEFVEKWNAKQTVTSYYPDYKKVVFTRSGEGK